MKELRPIYFAEGPIAVHLVEDGGVVVTRGDAVVRWESDHPVPLSSASVRSQLQRAGLLEKSKLWGFDTTAASSISIWIPMELELREKKRGNSYTAPVSS